jgi:hypothetical protein
VRFEVLSQGFVCRRAFDQAGPLVVGPRMAVTTSGEVVSSAARNSKLGVNDFVPLLFRSTDRGTTWTEGTPIWPELVGRWSIFVSVSRDAEGTLYLFGTRTPIDQPGETFWSDATQGLKPNELVWSRSIDGGRTWPDPAPIPMPIPGAAEAPGAMAVTRGGRWLACYSPYRTFDPTLEVDLGQVVALASDDGGGSWRWSSMLRFAEPGSGGAEAWIVELADGRLLGTAWHLDLAGRHDYPNAYALSHDGGATWSATRSTGTLGQSTGLAALADGGALFVYNQRKHGPAGVRLALARPTEEGFGLEADELVWRAETRTQHDSSGDHDAWGDFSFGEPSVCRLGDDTLLVALWCAQPSGCGIAWVRVAMHP